jgi:hypothetical protein
MFGTEGPESSGSPLSQLTLANVHRARVRMGIESA